MSRAKLDNTNRPDIRAYVGATGSGKGVSIRAHLNAERPARLLVWDPLAEYARFAKPAPTLASVVQAITRAGAGPFRVAYTLADHADRAQAFALMCELARRSGNCTFVVEELADVTTPSYAPPAWRRISTQGRHSGVRVVAATQRPALVDKTFLGNCTYIRCFTLREEKDQRRMASALGCSLDQVRALQTVERGGSTSIAYFERDFRSGAQGAKTITVGR